MSEERAGLAEVIPLYEANASDVAAMAKRFAKDLAGGKHGDVSAVAVVALNGEGVEVFGWGREAGSQFFVAGLLTAGAQKVADAP